MQNQRQNLEEEIKMIQKWSCFFKEKSCNTTTCYNGTKANFASSTIKTITPKDNSGQLTITRCNQKTGKRPPF